MAVPIYINEHTTYKSAPGLPDIPQVGPTTPLDDGNWVVLTFPSMPRYRVVEPVIPDQVATHVRTQYETCMIAASLLVHR